MAEDKTENEHRPVRIGLALDRDVVDLPCCDPDVELAIGDLQMPLTARTRIEPVVDLVGVGVFRLQVAALRDEPQSKSVAAYVRRTTELPTDVAYDGAADLYRIRVGRFATEAEADTARRRLMVLGFDESWLIRDGGELGNPAIRITAGEQVFTVTGRQLVAKAKANTGVPFDGGRYRGELHVWINDRGRLNVINELPLETYLRGVVPREMGPELYNEPEALRAQAVAARTFTVRNLGQFAAEGYDLCATPRCQVYGGMTAEHPRSDRAIEDTAGEVVIVGGAPAEVFYSAWCGGHSENVEVVFPAKRGDHLRGVPSAEAGVSEVAGGLEAGTSFPDGLTRALLPPPPGGLDAQSLSARLEHLVLLAALRPPSDRLKSLDSAEVRRYLASVLDLVLDTRLLAEDVDVASLPAREQALVRNFATTLDGDELTASDVELLLYRLAGHLGVLEYRRGVFLLADDESLQLASSDPDARRVEVSLRDLMVFGPSQGGVEAGPIELVPGDGLDVYHHRNRVLAIVQAKPPGALNLGKRARAPWSHYRSVAQLRTAVAERYPGFDFADFQILSRGVSGRVGRMRLLSTDGRTMLVEGLAVRWTLDLPDTLFTVKEHRNAEGRPAGWTFAGRGWGHGVGMCQTGAFAMAQRGRSYREILHHYFTDVEIGPLGPGDL